MAEAKNTITINTQDIGDTEKVLEMIYETANELAENHRKRGANIEQISFRHPL